MSAPSETQQFTHRILVYPLGLLYGSKGRFLSPENLVGRSGFHFPPDTPTLSGLYASQYQGDRDTLGKLLLAGPFWARQDEPENLYVPTPFHCLVENGEVTHLLYWQGGRWECCPSVDQSFNYNKLQYNTWIGLKDWPKVQSPQVFQKALEAKDPIKAEPGPWQPVPHLHPRLRDTERRSVGRDDDRGSLFLEYGIQLDPEVCLVYLANVPLADRCYRFGGEGHIVQIESEAIQPNEPARTLLDADLEKSFALACPGVWGSNRLSYRAPLRDKDNGLSWPDNPVQALLTQRPNAFRFRMGNQKDGAGEDVHQPNQPKLLSRGRYAVPAGSVYVLEKPLEPWLKWPDGQWPDDGVFPVEGYSFKRWGSALALPLNLTSS
jgi:CRISPR-associated protein Cmr3